MSSRQAFARCSIAVVIALPFGAGVFAAQAAGAAAVPGVPVAVSAVQRDTGGAQVSWQMPTSNGGSEINGFVVTPYKAGAAQPAVTFRSRKTREVLHGLKNGVSYRFTVAAFNAVGTGAVSAHTNAIVVGAPGALVIYSRQLTTRHRLLIMVRTGQYALVGNGALVTGMIATCTSSDGGATGTTHGKITNRYYLSNIYVSGLTHGKSYTCTIEATNSRGAGLPSEPSDPITM